MVANIDTWDQHFLVEWVCCEWVSDEPEEMEICKVSKIVVSGSDGLYVMVCTQVCNNKVE